MRVIVDMIMVYIAVGITGAILIERATNKYYNEIEKEVGEELNKWNVRILMLITVITWPKKLLWLVKFVIAGVKLHIEEQKN